MIFLKQFLRTFFLISCITAAFFAAVWAIELSDLVLGALSLVLFAAFITIIALKDDEKNRGL